jgi:hypothetical protein
VRTDRATTLHEAAARDHALKLSATTEGAHTLAQYRTRLRHHYWGAEYEDAIGQPMLSAHAGQTAAFARVHAGIASGAIGRILVRAGGPPSRDSHRVENAAMLSDLPYPFGAFVDPGQGMSTSGDGRLEWIAPVEFETPEGAVVVGPTSIPLEIGTSAASRTLLHLIEDRAVARWPYGQDWITVFVGLEQPFLRPAQLLADRRRRYLESLRDAEPLPQEASET